MAEQEHIPPLMPAIHLPDASQRPTPQSLIYTTERPTPKPCATQYLVKVQEAALTRDELTWPEVLDTSLRSSPAIPAHDICGIILSTPQTDEHLPDGPKFKVGDEIFGLLAFNRDGGAADCTVAEEREMAFKPRNVSAAEACTIPLSAMTAWQAFFEHGNLKDAARSGEEEEAQENGDVPNQSREKTPRPAIRVLITNASGGVGVQALQLLRSRTLFGTQKFWICGTCSHRNASFVRDELHADAVLDYSVTPDIGEEFASRGWEPVDFVLDCVGGETLRQVHSPAVVRNGGAVVSVVSPPQKESGIDFAAVRERRIKSSYFIVEPNGGQLQKVATLVEKEEVKGFVDRVYDLVDAREAMERVESKRARGKVVLRVNYYTS